MKTQSLFLCTHGLVAAATAGFIVVGIQSGTPLLIAVAAIASVVMVAAASWFNARKISDGLSVLESVVADQEKSAALNAGLAEFDQTADRIGELASRWETVAADTRTQARDFQSLMLMLNRRGAKGQPSSEQLRGLLAGLGNTLHSHMSQIDRGTGDIERHAKAITEGAEMQGNAIIKTTTYVEQLSSTIDSVATNASATQQAVNRTNDSATDALKLLEELIGGMDLVRTESQNCDKKLRGLCDPSQQIGSIVGTISDIAARTDLLALNASIESIRAGEHGRGFAIVADEVRKLAEQASDATREITSLLDSMQLVTQESIRGISRQRDQVESEVKRAAAAESAIRQICGAREKDMHCIQQIAESSTQQLQLAQDVVLAIEQISEIAKVNRGSAESVSWTMKSLTQATPQFNSAIDRLRMCVDSDGESLEGAESVAPLAPVAIPVPVAGMAQV
ncbi:MAG: methyl-accepting chemotaxis protein [Rubripirellula sp.]